MIHSETAVCDNVSRISRKIYVSKSDEERVTCVCFVGVNQSINQSGFISDSKRPY